MFGVNKGLGRETSCRATDEETPSWKEPGLSDPVDRGSKKIHLTKRWDPKLSFVFCLELRKNSINAKQTSS